MEEFISNSLDDTDRLGKKIAKALKKGDVIAYKGTMGAGKTTLTSSIVTALGGENMVSSPTFALMNEYTSEPLVRHFDMYRIDSYESLYSTGFFDYIEDGDSVLIIEWSENIENVLPDNTLIIEIAYGENEDQRIFKLYKIGEAV